MKEIVLNRLTIENFKGVLALTINFCGRDTDIYGDNATGKTTIYDSVLWLMFEKDSAGNGSKNFDVKPLNERGEVADHQAITSVEAEFSIDGEAKTFRRTFREVWTTRRGSSEPVYDGNASDYYVDGVPTKKNGFDAAIREMVGEELFRMLTSVSWFSAGMKWQERRAILFEMAGTMTDAEIMADNPDFSDLREGMGKLTMDEYRRKLQHDRKQFVGTRDDAPARLSECQKVIDRIGIQDFEKARTESATLHARFSAIANEIAAVQNDTRLSEVRIDIQKQNMAMDALESENRQHRAAQGNRSDILTLENLASVCAREISMQSSQISIHNNNIASANRSIDAARAKWVQVNGEAFAGGNCPTCGQALPFDVLQAKTESFNADKARRLQKIQEDADSLKQRIAMEEAAKAEAVKALAEKEKELAEISEKLERLNGQTARVEDLPDYESRRQTIAGELYRLEQERQSLEGGTKQTLDSLRAEQAAVRQKIQELTEIAAGEAVLNDTKKRMEQIREDARNASAALDAIDKMLFKCEEFVRFKAQFCEEFVNKPFKIAQFRLFREQANGGLEERCDVTVGGVPYQSLNNAMKINVGIDIINALSIHYGAHVPLFVDNAESVTKLNNCGSQVIRLIVSENDKELRIV